MHKCKKKTSNCSIFSHTKTSIEAICVEVILTRVLWRQCIPYYSGMPIDIWCENSSDKIGWTQTWIFVTLNSDSMQRCRFFCRYCGQMTGEHSLRINNTCSRTATKLPIRRKIFHNPICFLCLVPNLERPHTIHIQHINMVPASTALTLCLLSCQRMQISLAHALQHISEHFQPNDKRNIMAPH